MFILTDCKIVKLSIFPSKFGEGNKYSCSIDIDSDPNLNHGLPVSCIGPIDEPSAQVRMKIIKIKANPFYNLHHFIFGF